VWCAGAPESGARQGGADARQARDPDAEEAARRAPEPPPVPPRRVPPHTAFQRAAAQGARQRDEPRARQPAAGEPVHGRTQGDRNHRTTTAPTTVLQPIIQDIQH